MGVQDQPLPNLDDEDTLDLLTGRINRAFPRISDTILRCIARLPNSPVFVSDSHRDHLTDWEKTVREHLDDAEIKRAEEIVTALKKVFDIRASLDHALTPFGQDKSGNLAICPRGSHIITAGQFRRLSGAAALPDQKRLADHRNGIPVHLYAPNVSDEERYREKQPIALQYLIDLVINGLPQYQRDLVELSRKAVNNYETNKVQ